MKLRLIPDWRRAWRFFTMQAAAAGTLLSLVQLEVLPLARFAIPEETWPWVLLGFCIASIVLRLIAQSMPPPPSPSAQEPRP